MHRKDIELYLVSLYVWYLDAPVCAPGSVLNKTGKMIPHFLKVLSIQHSVLYSMDIKDMFCQLEIH